MRSSAILVHFQGHAPCVESLEVTNLFHRRLRFLSWNEQEATIWWHTGRIIRNIISCLAKDVSEHLVKEPPDIPRWHPHPLQKTKRPGRNDWSQPSHASRTDFLDSGPCGWLVFRCRESSGLWIPPWTPQRYLCCPEKCSHYYCVNQWGFQRISHSESDRYKRCWMVQYFILSSFPNLNSRPLRNLYNVWHQCHTSSYSSSCYHCSCLHWWRHRRHPNSWRQVSPTSIQWCSTNCTNVY